MESDRLIVFRELLNNRLNALLEGAGSTLAGLTEQREALTDAVDIAADETNRDFAIAGP